MIRRQRNGRVNFAALTVSGGTWLARFVPAMRFIPAHGIGNHKMMKRRKIHILLALAFAAPLVLSACQSHNAGDEHAGEAAESDEHAGDEAE